LKKTNNCIDILSTSNLTVVASVKHKFECSLIRNEKIVFCKTSSSANNYLFYKLKLRYKNNYVESEYLCKINPFNQHIYCNPYLLPCKNSACFSCINTNYNLVHKNIQCNFETCQQIHDLPKTLERDYQKNDLIDQNLIELLKNIISYGNKMVNSKGNYHLIIIKNIRLN
jgi:hypothetical protein